ncbi:MAG TPA: thioether cross-link-forming SCIFF peptide maturase [Bacillota bacterium]|nr:thioether cross-link-forming SCIFF peptide maturase [Bacillota bacterium]
MLGEANWHIFSCFGKTLLFDVKTGGLHELDEAGRNAALAYRDKTSLPEAKKRLSSVQCKHGPALAEGFEESVAEAYKELESMVAEGLLSDPDICDEEYAPGEETIVKALCLHVAHDCNLRCKYCFGKTGNFGMTRELMPIRVAKASIDFLLDRSGPRHNLNVDFFGGEPLLNFDVVKATVEYCDGKAKALGKHVDFTVTTNCVLLDDEVASFLNERNMLVVLSLDGRKEVNDRMRVMPGGGGSYDHVAPRLAKFIQARDPDSYYVRATYTRHNLDFASDVLHLADLGAKSISAEPVVGGSDREYGIQVEDISAIETEYERLTKLFVDRQKRGRGFLFYHFNIDLDGGPCLARRLSGCGAGIDYLAVSPSGSIYPCHQFVGKPEFRMGDVFRGSLDPGIISQFRHAHIYNKSGCGTCWARFICSGGCHAAAYGSSADILVPDKVACAIQKKRIECALTAQAMLKDTAQPGT